MVVHTTNYRGHPVSYSTEDFDNLQKLDGPAKRHYEDYLLKYGRASNVWRRLRNPHHILSEAEEQEALQGLSGVARKEFKRYLLKLKEFRELQEANSIIRRCCPPPEWYEHDYKDDDNMKYIENVGWFAKQTVFSSKKLLVETLVHLPSAKPMAAIADQTYLVKYNNGEITSQIWLTDYLKYEKSTQPYREADSYIIKWPDGKDITGRDNVEEIPQQISANIGKYQLTNFEKTFFCKLIGCSVMAFPGYCNANRWRNGWFCKRCGNAAYTTPGLPITEYYRDMPISELPYQGYANFRVAISNNTNPLEIPAPKMMPE